MVAILLLCLFRFSRLLGQWASNHRRREHCVAAATRGFPAEAQTASADAMGLFRAALSQVWSGWRGTLVFVQPDTVIRWQRKRFRRFWASLSQPKSGHRGRQGIAGEVRQLILQMATANPLWRAPRNSRRTENARHRYISDRLPKLGRRS